MNLLRYRIRAEIGFALLLGLCPTALQAMDMLVHLSAGGSQSYAVEQIRTITYDLTAPVRMNVLMFAGTNTPIELTAVRSITFSGEWTGVNRRRAGRIQAQLARLSLRTAAGIATLRFSLETSENVTVSVHAMDGRLVRTLISGHCTAGDHIVFWDGRTASGGSSAAGTYVLRLDRSHETRAFRFVTLR